MKIYAVEISGGEWEDSYSYEVMHRTEKSQVEYVCEKMQSYRPEQTCRVVEHELYESFTSMFALKNWRTTRNRFRTTLDLIQDNPLGNCWEC